MANFLALLARALGVGPALPTTQAAGAVPPTDGYSDLLTPQPAAVSAPPPSAQAQQAPAMPDASVTPQFRASSASGLPQRSPTSPIDMSALPTPPVMPKSGHVGDVLDNVFLGGSFRRAREAEYGDELKNYNDALSRAIAARNMGLVSALPQRTQAAAALSPDKTGEALASNDAFHALSEGQTGAYGDGSTMFAPKFDDKTGAFVAPAPNGGIVASPSAGGDFKAENGVVVSGRTGDVANRYALPQVLAPGARVGSFVPGVPGAPGAAPLPQVQPSMAPTGVPIPSELPSVLPGARLTSGYRDPAHNAAVGGVPGSWHTVGSPDAPGALDLAPPPGVSMSQFAASIARRLPQVRVIPEGDHAHLQPKSANTGQGLPQQGQGGPTTDSTGSIIDNGAQTGPLWSAPEWNGKTNRFEQTNAATGEIRDAGAGAFNPESLRKSVLDHEDYKQATAAMTAYKSMIGNADTMTGPSAYSMLDTFARTINPGAVARSGTIQVIESNLGLPAQLVGSLNSKVGKGALPDFVRQQILDAVQKFAQAHWDQANSLNQSNASVARRTGIDPSNVTAPLENMPGAVHVALPPREDLKVGDVYHTARGMAVWNGSGFVPYR